MYFYKPFTNGQYLRETPFTSVVKINLSVINDRNKKTKNHHTLHNSSSTLQKSNSKPWDTRVSQPSRPHPISLTDRHHPPPTRLHFTSPHPPNKQAGYIHHHYLPSLLPTTLIRINFALYVVCCPLLVLPARTEGGSVAKEVCMCVWSVRFFAIHVIGTNFSQPLHTAS